MKIYRKALMLILTAALGASAFALTGCGETAEEISAASVAETSLPQSLEEIGIDPNTVGIQPNVRHDPKNMVGFQLEMPQDGDTIGVIHTSLGDITLRFFPEQAPEAVTNFINLAKSGDYGKTAFHKVVANSLIQGGFCGSDEKNPNGVSSYGAPFEDEFCDSLCNIRGAVSMANNAKDSNGSQFFINQADAEAFRRQNGWRKLQVTWREVCDKLRDYKDSELLQAYIDENGSKFLNTTIVPDEVKQLYEQYGGNPTFDGAYNAADRGNTVFAQVIDGMNVVDKIAAVKVDDELAPTEGVLITSVEIKTYKAPSTTK